MLQLSFAGTAGRDAETRDAGQTTVTTFSVAVNGYDRRAKEKTTTWLKVNVWGKRGEQLESLVTKGSRVAGSGLFEVETYENKDGDTKTAYVVTCQDLTLQGGGQEREEPRERKSSKAPPKSKPAAADDDDDIPF